MDNSSNQNLPQGVSGISGTKHGSGSVVNNEYSAAASALTPMAAATPQEMAIHGNTNISDDSFLTMTASSISPEGNQEGKRRSRSPTARSKTPSTPRRRSSSGSGPGKRTLFERGLKSSGTKFSRRPSSAPRGHDRPPSPALPALAIRLDEPPQPDAAGRGTAGVSTHWYERVAQLEDRQTADRAFTAQLLKAVRSLESNFSQAHTRLTSVEQDLHHPRRDLAIRQEVRDMKAQLESDLVRGHEQIHNTVGPRMAELQAMLTEVQVSMTNFRDKEAQIEKYLVNPDGERPL